ncbi:MAG: DNA/RNA non-specific endonuclease [Bacteroidota bacterium]
MRFRSFMPLFCLFIICFFLQSCGLFEEEVVPVKKVNGEVHLTLGNPSDAQSTPVLARNYLVERPQYVLAYDDERGLPTWVSWNLSKVWLGSVGRSDDFLVDFSLPDELTRISSQDYSGSGFDRGHNCPSADRTLTRRDNEATFYMTNIIPQAPELNQEPWRLMEQYTRDLVRQRNNELYIIMGNYGEGGEGRNGRADRIGIQDRLVVPSHIWKVILVLDQEGDGDLMRITEDTRVIAVLTPNRNSNLKEWHEYRVSVDEIEAATGLDLFSALPTDLQEILEVKVDDVEI